MGAVEREQALQTNKLQKGQVTKPLKNQNDASHRVHLPSH